MAVNVTPVEEFSEINKLAATGDLWVINNTNQGNIRSRGIFAITIKDSNGDAQPVVIPETWIPINIAKLCDPEVAVRSQQFRDAIGKRNLIVIRSEEAKQILSGAEANKELKRVEEFRQGNAAAIGSVNRTRGDKVAINTGVTGSHMTAEQVVDESARTVENPDDNTLHRMVADYNVNSIGDDDIEEMFQTLSPSLDALKTASGNVSNTGSKLFNMIADMIDNRSIENA